MNIRHSAALVMVALAASAAMAQPLGTAFTYQGQLKNGGGPATGLHDLRFQLHDAISLGTPVGPAFCLDNVTVIDGLFTVSLDFGAEFAGQERFLEIEVRADAGLDCTDLADFVALAPRQALTAAPYSLFAMNAATATTAATATNADNANLLNGLDASAFMSLQAPTPGTQQVGHGNISGTLIVGDGIDATSASAPAVKGTSAAALNGVGGSFSAPDIGGTGVDAEGGRQGLFARSGAGSGWSLSFPGSAAVVADGFYHGIVAKSDPAGGGAGVVGNNSPGNGLAWFSGVGVSGIAYGAETRGVAGQGASNIWGVLGTDTYGVTGQRFVNLTVSNYGNLAGPFDGVTGEAQVNAGNGVMGTANNGASAYGIWGRSTSGYAGVFSGTTSVSGNFYATNKFFRIDHPQDPKNKYLIHSCVESNQQLNLYRGTVLCDAQGEATVDLPGYFNSLNGEPGYQLTCVGGFAPVYVATEAVNRFKIAGGRAGLKVCWTVYGTRQDPYAKAHPMVVEKAKEGDEAGRLLTPTEYGYPVEDGMTYLKEQQFKNAPRPTSPGIIEQRSK